jgi:hypothetical protein
MYKSNFNQFAMAVERSPIDFVVCVRLHPLALAMSLTSSLSTVVVVVVTLPSIHPSILAVFRRCCIYAARLV